MRIALFSDIHGNSIALDAVLSDIQQQGGVDLHLVVGDLAAIGHDPVGVLERLVRLSNARFVRGNTDRYLISGERPRPTLGEVAQNPALVSRALEVAQSFAWTQGVLVQGGWLDWLAGLPLEQRTILPDGTRLLCVHSTPGKDDDRGVYPGISASDLRPIIKDCHADLVCVGHTHWPVDMSVDGVRVINLGSVSNSFLPDLRASYVLVEAKETGYHVEHRRVEYDREAVIAAVRQAHHPAGEFIVQYMRGLNRPGWSKPKP